MDAKSSATMAGSSIENRTSVTVHRNPYVVSVTDRLEDFELLEQEWPNFLSKCEANHPFNTHEWIRSWYRSFEPTGDIALIRVRCEGALVCCIPVMRTPELLGPLKLRCLWPWINTHSFRWGLLCDSNHLAALDEAIDAIFDLGDWDCLDLYFLPSRYRVHRHLKDMLKRRQRNYAGIGEMNSPCLEIHGDWDSYVASLSKSRRESERRKCRKLCDKMGAVIEITQGCVDDLDKRLEDCWQVSAKTWKHAKGSSIAGAPERKAFYSEVAKTSPDWLILGLLYLDGVPIAFEYNILYNGTLYNLKLGYDEQHRSLSAGQVLRFNMLKWAFDNGVRIFDFMGHTAAYKSQFGSAETPHEDIRVFSDSYRGRLAGFFETRLRPVLRRVKHSLTSFKTETSG